MCQRQGYSPAQPQIVFEGNVPGEISKNSTLAALLAGARQPAAHSTPWVWLGEPIAIRDPLAAIFRRQSGSNLLIVGQSDEAALGMLGAALLSLAAQLADQSGKSGAEANLGVLDFGAADSAQADFFVRLSSLLPIALKLGRRRQLPEMLDALSREVQRRLDDDDLTAPTSFLVLYGLHRARDLRQDEGFGIPSFGDEPAAPNLAQQFATILREGPDVGIHTVVWCDTATNLNRTFDRRVLREFAMRVALQMSAEDSASLIDTPAASKLGLYRALFYSEDEGRLEKFRPYAIADNAWLTKTGEQLRSRAVSYHV